MHADGRKEQPFYVSATGPMSRPRRALKHGDAFAVFDSHGDIGAVAGGPDGLFDADTRFLSKFELLINDVQPLLLGASTRDDNLHMYVDLTNPDISLGEDGALAKDTIHISRTIFLRDGGMHVRVASENHGASEVTFELTVNFDNDFADIFEVRGIKRKRRGFARRRVLANEHVMLSYDGLDGRRRDTSIHFEPVPTKITENFGRYEIKLRAKCAFSFFVSVSCRGPRPQAVVPFFKGLRALDRERRAETRELASVETTSATANEILCRSIADYYMLVTDTVQGHYPYAGIPWYSTTFGRDGIIAAMQLLWLDASVARGVLRRLAALQATQVEPERDAQPGKILHEMRGGEMAALNEVPFGLYYGSVDATPLFVMLAGLYLERTGDALLISELWPNIEAALRWIDEFGDVDGDGFVEYRRAAETGLANQGWKDSYDAVFHADGQLATGAIALVEVQGYVYAAKQSAGMCARRLGFDERGRQLVREAEGLRVQFQRDFWLESEGYFALALDGSKKPCAVRSSNAFHPLFCGIASAQQACSLVADLAKSGFNSGWGVRTVARGASRYNPMSYHNGSVWPHDNALIAIGLARHGFKQEILPIFEGIFGAATWMDQRRLPELYCGFNRKRGRGPTQYPVACSPQAWASGAPFMIIQAMLGLEFSPEAREVRLRNPILPPSLEGITIRDLQLGDAKIDFSLHKDGEALSLRVLKSHGSIRVTLVIDPIQTSPSRAGVRT